MDGGNFRHPFAISGLVGESSKRRFFTSRQAIGNRRTGFVMSGNNGGTCRAVFVMGKNVGEILGQALAFALVIQQFPSP